MARGQRTISSKSWVGVSTGAVPVVITETQALVMSIGIAESSVRETLLRSRGQLNLMANPDTATDEGVVALGIIVVHSNAASIGGTSLPGPSRDPGADWLWHRYVPLLNTFGASSPANAWGSLLSDRIEVDSKAMRRVPPDHTVALIVEGSSGVSNFALVEVSGGLRMLFGH